MFQTPQLFRAVAVMVDLVLFHCLSGLVSRKEYVRLSPTTLVGSEAQFSSMSLRTRRPAILLLRHSSAFVAYWDCPLGQTVALSSGPSLDISWPVLT
ncbi:hypothetical protein F5Y07DRAFT_31055 [Xylaria sp. FL0933]|nr:hypothetical protein F5Y07DRAFT_31055 [Xylaria sp. FL0933]